LFCLGKTFISLSFALAKHLSQIYAPFVPISNPDFYDVLAMQSLIERDRARVWHPCTQHSDHEWLPMLGVARADGALLFDESGKSYIDAISSWWTCLIGHRHAPIVAAIKDQLDQLDHVIFGGATHEPAVALAEKLCALSGLDRVFYADVGSAAVEVALKMSFHYWRNMGRPEKQRFVCLSNSYHGETLGALSVTDVALYRSTYGAILLEPIIAPSPDHYLRAAEQSELEFADQQADQLEVIFAQQHAQISALIVEPLVQCAGGMRMYHPQYLKRARELCNRYEIHFIADEIAVGFGRTGKMFACQHAEVLPDFLLLGKGLTGGLLPLSAVLCTDKIYQAFYASYESLRAFLHSHSFTGNPLVTRAALATLNCLEAENWLERNQATARCMQEALAGFSDHAHVGDVRQMGMIAAIELVKDRKTLEPFPWQERRGLRVYQYGLKNGALLRPLGNVIYLMPPYCISESQIAQLSQTIADGIAHAIA
jgi:adenosylmethionine---8-amino-7-oxononanoate aminotransferase